MNYNYTACCWFPTSSNILILPSQFWQIRFESCWLHCSKCRILVLLRYRSDDVMAFCYSIVMVPNKRSLQQALDSGLEPGTCIVSNRCDHRSSGCQKLFRTSFHVDELLWCHTSVLYYISLTFNTFLLETGYTVEPRYNEVLGTMKITLLYIKNKEI